uniref:FAS1 domain-containing protein n=1 Tax=Fagus sylvatica TaxID=28930 RepID=A0A2N9HWR9_FAGSY
MSNSTPGSISASASTTLAFENFPSKTHPPQLLVPACKCSVQPAKAPAQPAKAPVQPAKAPAQSAKAPTQSAEVPPVLKGPPDITKILGKAGGFSVFIRLLKSTGVSDQIYGQLNNSNNGFTIFAPTDAAFSNLKPGTINSLSDLQKTQLLQFHILNSVVTLSNFQTLSNPVPTEAGDTSAGKAKTKSPAEAPTLSKPKNTNNDDADTPSVAAKVDESSAISLNKDRVLVSIGVVVVAFIVTKGLES